MDVGALNLEEVPEDQLIDAHTATAGATTNALITLLGFGFFCMLSLMSPDSLLLGDDASLDLPIGGKVSFLAFMFIGPAILIALRSYLFINMEHFRQLEAEIAERNICPPPKLEYQKNPVVLGFGALVLYLLVPALMAGFAWKAGPINNVGEALFVTTIVVTAIHLALLVWRYLSGKPNLRAAVYGLILVASTVLTAIGLSHWNDIHRSFYLYRADLSGKPILKANLRGADMRHAVLENAVFTDSDLTNANLLKAKLKNAQLSFAIMKKANLFDADLTAADLRNVSDLECDQLLLARNWEKAKKDSSLNCAEGDNYLVEGGYDEPF